MPKLTVWMIRASLLHLGAGFFFGALILWNKGNPVDATVWLYLPAHIELLLVGWTVQLAMGMAFWIMPRFSHEPRYGSIKLGWAAFVLVNAGVLVVVASRWASADDWVNLMGHSLEAGAVVVFVWQIWRRIKPFGT